jgi:methylenetetrahydrofolate reductase (NADPH)
LVKIVHKYEDNPEDLKKAGIDYALEQIQDLLDHGVDGIHLYAMNQPSVLKSMLPIINQEIKTKCFVEDGIIDHA